MKKKDQEPLTEKKEREGVLQTHTGEDMPETMDLFAEAPLEIGAISSACSILKKGENPSTIRSRLVSAGIATAIGLAVAFGVNYFIVSNNSGKLSLIWYFILAGVGFFLGVIGKSPEHHCTYVGDKGVAEFVMDGNRNSAIKKEIFLYHQAESSIDYQFVTYTHGHYEGTSYTYKWLSEQEKNVFQISGIFNNPKGPPKKMTDRYYFGVAAAAAWMQYRFQQMLNDLENRKPIHFRFDDNTLEFGFDSFIIRSGDNVEQWMFNDFTSWKTTETDVKIYSQKFHEGGWLSKLMGKGCLTIPYSTMPNGRLFVWLIKELLSE